MPPAPYRVIARKSVDKDLARIPGDTRARALLVMHALANDPRPTGNQKLKGARNGYRVRIGDYRIVYTVDDARRIVEIVRIAHRKDVYRDL